MSANLLTEVSSGGLRSALSFITEISPNHQRANGSKLPVRDEIIGAG